MKELPRLVINFKNYEEASSVSSMDLLKIIKKYAEKNGVEVAVSANVLDLKDVLREAGNVQVYAQHVDPIGYGSYTGKVNPEYLSEIGVKGSLVNHSEDRVGLYTMIKEIDKLRALEMCSLVCVESLEEAKVVEDMGPSVVAFEPPELIGGDVSVATASPDIVKKIVSNVNLPVMVGAGIKSVKDVEICMELGCHGVLVASGVVKSTDPGQVVDSFLKVIKKYV
jgi:triosephosphate isomerase